MLEEKEKQRLKYGFSDTISGLEWLETCDMIERSWSVRRRGRVSSFPVSEAAHRAIRRRHAPDAPPPRHAFRTTADYYEAALPLMMGCKHLDQVDSAWRYMRPMMIRLLMASWFRPSS